MALRRRDGATAIALSRDGSGTGPTAARDVKIGSVLQILKVKQVFTRVLSLVSSLRRSLVAAAPGPTRGRGDDMTYYVKN